MEDTRLINKILKRQKESFYSEDSLSITSQRNVQESTTMNRLV